MSEHKEKITPGSWELDFIMLTGAAGFVRAIAYLLERKSGSCGDKGFADAIIHIAAIARGQADIIEGVADRLAVKAGGGGNA